MQAERAPVTQPFRTDPDPRNNPAAPPRVAGKARDQAGHEVIGADGIAGDHRDAGDDAVGQDGLVARVEEVALVAAKRERRERVGAVALHELGGTLALVLGRRAETPRPQRAEDEHRRHADCRKGERVAEHPPRVREIGAARDCGDGDREQYGPAGGGVADDRERPHRPEQQHERPEREGEVRAGSAPPHGRAGEDQQQQTRPAVGARPATGERDGEADQAQARERPERPVLDGERLPQP